ncbi:MAG: hypothetical protein ACOYVJ_10720 [Nitrospirota bacterium]
MAQKDCKRKCEKRRGKNSKNLFRDSLFFAAVLLVFSLLPGQVTGAHAGELKPGTASGAISIDGTPLKLHYAYAMAQPNTFEEEKTDIAVLLTEKPVPDEAFKDVEDLRNVGLRQQGWVYFEINDQQKPITEVSDHPSLNGQQLQMSGITTSGFVPKEFNKERVSGSFKTEKAEKIFDHTYEVEVTFAALVREAKIPEPLPNAQTGNALPPDGGEPGKAYMKFVRAVHKKDIETIKKLAPSPDEGFQYTDEELKAGIEFMAALTPKDTKISKGFVEKDRAVLYVTGTLEKEKQYGTIEMIRKEGTWRVKKEAWSNTPPEKSK